MNNSTPQGPGFYKLQEGVLFYAPNFVYSPTVSLLIENKDTYSYPADGWWWFSDENNAREAFGMPTL